MKCRFCFLVITRIESRFTFFKQVANRIRRRLGRWLRDFRACECLLRNRDAVKLFVKSLLLRLHLNLTGHVDEAFSNREIADFEVCELVIKIRRQ